MARDWLLYPMGEIARFRAILDRVSADRGVTAAEIMGRSKVHKIAHARHEVIARAVHDLGWSKSRVGRKFDLDHTSIIHAVRAHEKREKEQAKWPVQ